MRSLRLAGLFLAFVSALAASGCTLDVSGIDVGAGGTSSTNATSSGLGGDSSPSSSTVSTASSASTGCPSTIEICDDGIDNNCDDLIDCADPQCADSPTGRECVAPAPAGWTLVAYVPGETSTCPAGSGDLTKVAEAPTSSDPHCACGCDCSGVTYNPCVHGTLKGVIGSSCTAFAATLPVTGGCDPIGEKLGAYKSIKATPLDPAPMDVAGKPTLPGTKPGLGGVTCAPSAGKAGGCMGGQACLLKTTSAGLCIQSPGDVACPDGPFTNHKVVGAFGGAAEDLRTCDACTCSLTAASCSNPTFSGYPNGNCNSSADPVPVVKDVCSSVTNGDWTGDDHFMYTATPVNPTCTLKGAEPNVTGILKPKDAITTICCAP